MIYMPDNVILDNIKYGTSEFKAFKMKNLKLQEVK